MRPSLRLPEGTIVVDVAEATRDALESFLALDPAEPQALSRWLVGPYRAATRYAPRRLQPTNHRSAHGPATPVSVSAIVAHAQAELGEAIDAARELGAERLVARLPDTVDVVPVHDVYDAHGFAAMDSAHRRLRERVLSLLLADYLTRPDDFVAGGGPRRPRRQSTRMAALG